MITAATLALAGCPDNGATLPTTSDPLSGTDTSSSSAGTGQPTTSMTATTDPGPVTGDGPTTGTSSTTTGGTTTGDTTTGDTTTGDTTTGDTTTGTTTGDTTGGTTTGDTTTGDTTTGDTTTGDTMGCGDTTTGDTGQIGPPPPAALKWSHSQVKRFDFTWQPVAGADYYQLLESADGGPDYTQVGGDLCGEATSITVPLHFRPDARYLLRSCNGDGCTDSAPVDAVGSLAPAVGYFKASNAKLHSLFGWSVALSADGETFAVGAPREDSSAKGINGDQANNGAIESGAVYVFVKKGAVWSQQADIKASNSLAGLGFGDDVSLSADGSTLAVGCSGSGSRVYVFTRSANVWSEQSGDSFGFVDSMELSGDGNTLAIGSAGEGNPGGVSVYKRTGQVWAQQVYVKASNAEAGDLFGSQLALSVDGNTLAVGAPYEDSAAKGIDGNQADNSLLDAGAVYVFTRVNDAWSQQAYVKASNPDMGDWFGVSGLSLSGNGDTLAVGVQFERSAAKGVDGDQNNNNAPESGAVYVFERANKVWAQSAYLKSSNSDPGDWFGYRVALSTDGAVLAISALGEDSATVGINGDAFDNSLNPAGTGAAYVFTQTNGLWTQRAYVKPPNPGPADYFGGQLALSGDGTTLAVGAYRESSKATGIGGDQANDNAMWAGAAYLF